MMMPRWVVWGVFIAVVSCSVAGSAWASTNRTATYFLGAVDKNPAVECVNLQGSQYSEGGGCFLSGTSHHARVAIIDSVFGSQVGGTVQQYDSTGLVTSQKHFCGGSISFAVALSTKQINVAPDGPQSDGGGVLGNIAMTGTITVNLS
ncbi:MAG: hypothetical protein NVSMB57_09620 [Actinomycetota bacterium]